MERAAGLCCCLGDDHSVHLNTTPPLFQSNLRPHHLPKTLICFAARKQSHLPTQSCQQIFIAFYACSHSVRLNGDGVLMSDLLAAAAATTPAESKKWCRFLHMLPAIYTFCNLCCACSVAACAFQWSECSSNAIKNQVNAKPFQVRKCCIICFRRSRLHNRGIIHVCILSFSFIMCHFTRHFPSEHSLFQPSLSSCVPSVSLLSFASPSSSTLSPQPPPSPSCFGRLKHIFHCKI
jgi:hypothetical protein